MQAITIHHIPLGVILQEHLKWQGNINFLLLKLNWATGLTIQTTALCSKIACKDNLFKLHLLYMSNLGPKRKNY